MHAYRDIYDCLTCSWTPPPFAVKESWKDDETWGRERLQGARYVRFGFLTPSHAIIKRLDVLPAGPEHNFPCEESVKPFLRAGRTFVEEMADARFYIGDYR